MARPNDTPGSRNRQEALMRDPELFNRMLDNQATELKLRSEELALRDREREGAQEYAFKSLELQAQDRREERVFQKSFLSRLFCFLFFVLLTFIVGFCYALYLGKDEVVIEIVKAVIYLTVGGVGGYSASSLKSAKQDDINE